MSRHPILKFQRIAGNKAAGRLLQAKLEIGPAGDHYEREADRVASRVLGNLDGSESGTPAMSMGPVRLATRHPVIQRFTDPLATMTTFQAPLGASGWWGAKYGCYRNSCNRPHRGLDIYAAQGTDIRATEDGAVTHGSNPGGYGDYVWLRNGTGNYYRYAHLGSREPAGNYSEGDTIGDIGISGNSNAARPHLHFGYYVGGRTESTHDVDPETNLADLTQPTQVRSAAGTTTNINRSDPEPCTPCAM